MSIRPTSNYHYHQWFRKQPKIDLTMITVEEACLFGEWLADNFQRNRVTWTPTNQKYKHGVYTTIELWNEYQKFLGAKK